MLGAIAGDIIGSVFEWNSIKATDFPLFSKESHFTDDTILTIAIADSILNKKEYGWSLRQWALKYPNADYGSSFKSWFLNGIPKFNSFGNDSAMRVSPVGFAFNTIEEVLLEAKKSAEVSHNHPEGIKGAQATAAAIFLTRQGKNKKDVKEYIEKQFGYDLSRKLDEIRPAYKFDATCQGSVPESIIAFLESGNFEDAVRKAVSLGGDSDTMACIAGSVAQAFYKEIPFSIVEEVKKRLPDEMIFILENFRKKFNC